MSDRKESAGGEEDVFDAVVPGPAALMPRERAKELVHDCAQLSTLLFAPLGLSPRTRLYLSETLFTTRILPAFSHLQEEVRDVLCKKNGISPLLLRLAAAAKEKKKDDGDDKDKRRKGGEDDEAAEEDETHVAARNLLVAPAVVELSREVDEAEFQSIATRIVQALEEIQGLSVQEKVDRMQQVRDDVLQGLTVDELDAWADIHAQRELRERALLRAGALAQHAAFVRVLDALIDTAEGSGEESEAASDLLDSAMALEEATGGVFGLGEGDDDEDEEDDEEQKMRKKIMRMQMGLDPDGSDDEDEDGGSKNKDKEKAAAISTLSAMVDAHMDTIVSAVSSVAGDSDEDARNTASMLVVELLEGRVLRAVRDKKWDAADAGLQRMFELCPTRAASFFTRGTMHEARGNSAAAFDDIVTAHVLFNGMNMEAATMVEKLSRKVVAGEALRRKEESMAARGSSSGSLMPAPWFLRQEFSRFTQLASHLGLRALRQSAGPDMRTHLDQLMTWCDLVQRACDSETEDEDNEQSPTEAFETVWRELQEIADADIGSGPVRSRYIFFRALMHHARGETDAASRLFAQAWEADQGNVYCLVLLSFVHAELERADEAMAHATQAIRHASERQLRGVLAEALMHRGQIRLLRGQKREAASDLQKSCQLEQTPASLVMLGMAVLELHPDKPEAALSHLSDVVEAHPHSIQALLALSEACFALGDVATGLKHCKTAASLDATCPLPYERAGKALRQLHEYDMSLKMLDKAIEVDPNFAPSHMEKAMSLLAAEQSDEANAAFDAAEQCAKYAQEWILLFQFRTLYTKATAVSEQFGVPPCVNLL